VPRLLIAFLLTVSSGVCLTAQTIQGTVVDDSTARPIDGASLTLLDAQGADVGHAPRRSDAAGRFVVQAGKHGTYRLRVMRIGYQPLTSKAFELADAELLVLMLRMTSVAEKLPTMVVTERRHLNLKELMSPMGFELRRSRPTMGLLLDTTALKQYGIHPMTEVFESYRGMSGLDTILFT
jgi:hypothetical protein